MQRWKQLLLSTYYHGTLPYRQWANARAARAGKAPVIVLFYHRVADDHPNDWTVSNQLFSEHLDWLAEHFDLVSFAAAQRRIRGGKNDRAAVSITFDDGYADNCLHALPLLIKRGIPCTYFVSTAHILDGVPFPHDVANGLALCPNTVPQIQALDAAGVEIGVHTRTHADLGRVHDPRQLHDEVVRARDELAALLGHPVRYFAFPYGKHENLTPDAFRLARAAGYDAVCSAYGGYNYPGDDPFHLQRIHADDEMARFMNWLSVDPRKFALVKRFQYDGETRPLCSQGGTPR